jgi:hypothetical protein
VNGNGNGKGHMPPPTIKAGGRLDGSIEREFREDLVALLLVGQFGGEFNLQYLSTRLGTAHTRGLRIGPPTRNGHGVEVTAHYGSNDSRSAYALSAPPGMAGDVFRERLMGAQETIEAAAAAKKISGKQERRAEVSAPAPANDPPLEAAAPVEAPPAAPALAEAPAAPTIVKLVGEEDYRAFAYMLREVATSEGLISVADTTSLMSESTGIPRNRLMGEMRLLLRYGFVKPREGDMYFVDPDTKHEDVSPVAAAPSTASQDLSVRIARLEALAHRYDQIVAAQAENKKALDACEAVIHAKEEERAHLVAAQATLEAELLAAPEAKTARERLTRILELV